MVGTKTWDDDGDSGHKRPNILVIRLMIGDEPALDDRGKYIEREISKETDWKFEFPNLPLKDKDNKQIPYRIVEFIKQDEEYLPLEDYTAIYADPKLNEDETVWTCEVKNTLYQINITVLKVWDDHDNVYGIRPSSVTVPVALNAAGTRLPQEKEFSEMRQYRL